jgi:hypothetical protein
MTTHDCTTCSTQDCALAAVLKASRTRKMPCASTPSSNVSDCPARRLGLCSMPCYGRGGMYHFPAAKALRDHNRAVIADCLTLPASEAIPAIARAYAPTVGKRATLHRLHDTGDVDSLEHLLGLIQLAKQRPTVGFWLPTHRSDLLPLVSPAGMPNNMLVRLPPGASAIWRRCRSGRGRQSVSTAGMRRQTLLSARATVRTSIVGHVGTGMYR